jgi:hypothetical protein
MDMYTAGKLVLEEIDDIWQNLEIQDKCHFRNLTEFRKFATDSLHYHLVTDEIKALTLQLKKEDDTAWKKLKKSRKKEVKKDGVN